MAIYTMRIPVKRVAQAPAKLMVSLRFILTKKVASTSLETELTPAVTSNHHPQVAMSGSVGRVPAKMRLKLIHPQTSRKGYYNAESLLA
ncbi:hypothetical protein [Tengunoibacter tsumagoiensis]|uniref:Uncharacterized protein n=1 Tax=Tengunoibacter tsumagoiensis TaxID=2014871 RepID=A0A401ZXF0_9CHLR|nr:hypothetical protein [Tengunoibacter tsumagoiensis]GCE11521.1 hypothetical protein KTT_13800 [Tengunoibacter tsumagoiensis]